MVQTLRPRGLVELVEFDFHMYDEHQQPILPNRLEEETPAIARWMNFVNVAIEQRGGEPDAANHLHQWMVAHPNLEEVVYREFWFQSCPWKRPNEPNASRGNRTGAMMRDDIIVRSLFPDPATVPLTSGFFRRPSSSRAGPSFSGAPSMSSSLTSLKWPPSASYWKPPHGRSSEYKTCTLAEKHNLLICCASTEASYAYPNSLISLHRE